MELKLLEIKRSTGKKIIMPSDVYEMMQDEALIDRECMWVLHLNTRLFVIEKELVGMGTLSMVYSTPREIFKKAIINSTKSIICVHNHPTGFPDPSEADKEFSKNLYAAGEIIGIEVLDDMIIGRNGYFSFYQANQSHNIRDYSNQIELFIEQDFVCDECGEWIKKEDARMVDNQIYCPYCWKASFGEMSEDWPQHLFPLYG